MLMYQQSGSFAFKRFLPAAVECTLSAAFLDGGLAPDSVCEPYICHGFAADTGSLTKQCQRALLLVDSLLQGQSSRRIDVIIMRSVLVVRSSVFCGAVSSSRLCL
jgi:hypothetical protein